MLIRCVPCTQQIAAASGSGSGNTQDEGRPTKYLLIDIYRYKFGSKPQCRFYKTFIPTNFIDTSATPALDNNGPGKISNSLPSASSMDLCPDCFAGRVEIGNHKAFHSYQVR